MTKNVRIENADTSEYKVVVEVWIKGPTGEFTKNREEVLSFPTALSQFLIHDGQYLVVREAPRA